MRNILILLFVFLALSAKAQTINKESFMRTVWFADNKNKTFWKSDTVRLIQCSNLSHEGTNSNHENALKNIGHRDYLIFEFKMQNKLIYTEPIWEYKNGVPPSVLKWKYDKKENTISIFEKEELLVKLKPISKRQIILYPKTSKQAKELITEEITFETSNLQLR